MSRTAAERPADSVEYRPYNPLTFVGRVWALCIVELQKVRHDRTELYSRVIQPFLWLVIFGATFTNLRTIPTGGIPYLDYMAPGILAQSVLMMSIFFAILLTLDREAGVLTKLLVTPTPRAALVTGKAFAAAIRSLTQAVAVILIATALGVDFIWHPLNLLGVTALIVLCATIFTSFGILFASLLQVRERLMGLGQAIIMPLFFGSNALYPISLMPGWLQVFSQFNPLTYAVDGLRHLLVGTPGNLWLDFGVLTGAAIAMVAIAASQLGRLAR